MIGLYSFSWSPLARKISESGLQQISSISGKYHQISMIFFRNPKYLEILINLFLRQTAAPIP